MAIERAFDLSNFIEFIKTHQNSIPELMYFNILVPSYDATFGGCKCSVEARKSIADAKFISVIQTKINENFWVEVKKLTLADKIVFKDRFGKTFQEI